MPLLSSLLNIDEINILLNLLQLAVKLKWLQSARLQPAKLRLQQKCLLATSQKPKRYWSRWSEVEIVSGNRSF